MFKKIFIDLCNKNNESPSSVCRKINITPATYSCWTEESIPRRATLQRIADYFNVSIDYLLGADSVPTSICPDDENPWILKLCELVEKENVDTQITVYEHVKSILKDNNTISPSLTSHETNVMKAYRDQPEMQPAVDRILGITEEGTILLYEAAKSAENRKPRIIEKPTDQWENIKAEPDTEDELL